jgi:hypothetical protein
VTILDADLSILPNPFVTGSGASVSDAGPADSETTSFRDRRLIDIVSENDVSVRLANSIATAAETGTLPFATIGEYVDAAEEASTILCRTVRNFGTKTARELEALVRDECARHPRPWVKAAADADAKVREARRAELLALFEAETIGVFVAGEHVSVRLSNVLARPEFGGRPLIEIFDASVFTIASMMQIQNLGRKSIDEFRLLCARLVARRFRTAGFDPTGCEAAAHLLLGGMDAASLVVEAFNVADLKDDVPAHSTLSERLDWLVKELEPRAADILRRRFGIGQASAETLEEIGACFGVTRERIRQIEAKSLRLLQKRTLRAPIHQLLANEAAAAWSALSPCGLILLRTDVNDRKRLVAPHIFLALAIVGTTLGEWIEEIAAPFPLGWHVSESDRKIIDEAARLLSSDMDCRPLPRAVTDFGSSLHPPAVAAACELILGMTVRAGYVLPARVGARLARAIGLHAVLASRGGVLDLFELLNDYHSRFPHDLCTVRDAEIVMEAASHLFLEIEERRWTAVGHGGAAPPPQQSTIAVRPSPEESGTIAFALQAALKARGPTRLGDLLDDASGILPEGRSINSIGPVLLTRHELFVRLLPGVYGLPEHLALADKIPENAPYLFNDYQARLYCLARYAGEPTETFPLWSAQTEYRLCRWARHSGGPGTLNSLLAIADVKSWSMSDQDMEQWLHLKARLGRFEFGAVLRLDAAYERPDLERVLAACISAESIGALNWMAANRICGRKIDTHSGVGMIALLVQFGALAEPELGELRWQLRHMATPLIRQLVVSLTKQLSNSGDLTWESPIGKELVERAAAAAVRPDSWIDTSAFAAMVGNQPQQRPPDEEGVDPVEEVLAQHRRNREAAKREERLQWLLADA